MKKLVILMVSVLAAGLMNITPATAGDNSGATHNANDPGYNDPIKVQCHDATYRWLGLGVSSSSPGKCPYGGWITSIIAGPGEVIKCTDNSGRYYEFRYGQFNSIGGNIYFDCNNSLA